MRDNNLASPDITYTLPDPTLVMNQLGQNIMLAAGAGGAVLLILYATYVAYSRRSWLPFLFPFAGLACVILEPLADTWANAYHAPVGQIMFYSAEGHPVPLHVFFIYAFYFGSMNVFLYDRFVAADMTPKTWWKAAFWAFVGVTALEQVPIYLEWWYYYGNHPFKIGGIPLAMAAGNAVSVVVPSLLVYRMMPVLQGWKQLLILILMPAAVVGAHTATSIPGYTMLGQNTEAIPYWSLQLSTIMTVIFGLFVLWLVIGIVHDLFPNPSRSKPESRSPARSGEFATNQQF